MSIRVLGIIPARFGSTRLPGKPLITIQGKTLLQRTFENARRATLMNQLLVATDDSKIATHVKEFGGEAIITSSDCPSGTDRLGEVLKIRPELLNCEAIVNIQGDEPCLEPHSIELAIKLLLEDPQASMATLITPLKNEAEAYNPSIVKCVIDKHHNALYFSRSCIPSNKKLRFNSFGNYYRHVGLYVYRPSFLLHLLTLSPTPLQLEEDLEQLKVLEHGYRIKTAITDEVGIGVDTFEDLKKLEQWIMR